MSEARHFDIGSGNIYEDLGFAEPEIERAKAQLARQIATIVKARHLTQVQAGQLLGIDQPKVSALLRGRLGGFTAGRLMRLMTRLDFDVDISTRPKSNSEQAARIIVHPAPDDLEPMVAGTPERGSRDGMRFS